MNRLAIFYGCVLIASSAIAETQQGAWDIASAEVIFQSEGRLESFKEEVNRISETYSFDIHEIEYIEEEDMALGFDPYDYLPEDFDPYATYFDLGTIEFIEDEKDLALDFDASKYLPEGFDAYSDILGVGSINFIEEEDTDLGFDTQAYLPEGFSPYEAYFDLNAIIYIKMEDLEDDFSMVTEPISW